MIKAVVIDVDDTLCLTEAATFALENATLVKMGREPMTRSVHKETWGMPLFEAMLKRSPGIDLEAFKDAYLPAIEQYIADGKLDSIPDENFKALDTLISRGKCIMLLTSRTHAEFKHMVHPDHLLASRVKAFYYRDNMQFHKPDPRAFDELLLAHNLLPEECIYVGDSPSDAKAANGAGVFFVASLESGIRQQQDFKDFRVDAFINQFPDVIKAVAAIEHR